MTLQNALQKSLMQKIRETIERIEKFNQFKNLYVLFFVITLSSCLTWNIFYIPETKEFTNSIKKRHPSILKVSFQYSAPYFECIFSFTEEIDMKERHNIFINTRKFLLDDKILEQTLHKYEKYDIQLQYPQLIVTFDYNNDRIYDYTYNSYYYVDPRFNKGEIDGYKTWYGWDYKGDTELIP